MPTRYTALIQLVAMLFAFPLAAHEYKTGDLTIDHPISRPNLPDRPMAAYMTIMNAGDAGDRLIAASSPEFDTIEIHTVKETDGVMKMIQLDGIEVAPGEMTELVPGGFHLMLFGAKDRYEIGESFPVTLEFAQSGKVDIVVQIEKPKHGEASHGGHGHGGHGHGGHDTGQTN
ncbi:MAG: copper chaperone PCu(A)C [Pseudomonadota bacterium]